MAKLKIRNDEGQFVEVGACHIPMAIDNIEYETGELYNGKKVYAKT